MQLAGRAILGRHRMFAYLFYVRAAASIGH